MSALSKSRLGRGLSGIITSAVSAPAAPAAAPAANAANAALASAGSSSSATDATGSTGGPSSASSSTPAAPASPVGASPSPGFAEIAVQIIVPSPYQARREILPEQLTELAESIRNEGLLQPVVVRKVGDKYELIAGERRWRAFLLLKIKTIPARVVTASNASAAALGLIENLQREGLNPIEEAYGYASLIRDFDLTQEAAAERVGKARTSVANALRLLSLEGELQSFVAKNILSVGHAKVLLGIEDPDQRRLLARRVIEEGLSVRSTEKLVLAVKTGAPAPAGAAKTARGTSAEEVTLVAGIERQLGAHFGARVAVKHTAKRGSISIEYHGNDDLRRILARLGLEA